MKRDYSVYLYDILEQIDTIYEFAVEEEWDKKTRYAMERALSILAEAANRLPQDIRNEISEVEWHRIRGFRNLLIHEYEIVNPAVLKDICANHLAPLKKAVSHYLKRNT